MGHFLLTVRFLQRSFAVLHKDLLSCLGGVPEDFGPNSPTPAQCSPDLVTEQAKPSQRAFQQLLSLIILRELARMLGVIVLLQNEVTASWLLPRENGIPLQYGIHAPFMPDLQVSTSIHYSWCSASIANLCSVCAHWFLSCFIQNAANSGPVRHQFLLMFFLCTFTVSSIQTGCSMFQDNMVYTTSTIFHFLAIFCRGCTASVNPNPNVCQ